MKMNQKVENSHFNNFEHPKKAYSTENLTLKLSTGRKLGKILGKN